MKKVRLPCRPSRGQQTLHQRWMQATKVAKKGSTLALKLRADIDRSPKNGISDFTKELTSSKKQKKISLILKVKKPCSDKLRTKYLICWVSRLCILQSPHENKEIYVLRRRGDRQKFSIWILHWGPLPLGPASSLASVFLSKARLKILSQTTIIKCCFCSDLVRMGFVPILCEQKIKVCSNVTFAFPKLNIVIMVM